MLVEVSVTLVRHFRLAQKSWTENDIQKIIILENLIQKVFDKSQEGIKCLPLRDIGELDHSNSAIQKIVMLIITSFHTKSLMFLLLYRFTLPNH